VAQELLNDADVSRVANECRKVWHLACLRIPARRTASFTACWGTDSCR
jgi:hypothetical protein